MVDGNHQPIEVWIQNQTRNLTKKIKPQVEPTWWVLSRQLIMWLSSVYGPQVPVWTPAMSEHAANAHWDPLQDLGRGISELLDSLWRYLALSRLSHVLSVTLLSGESNSLWPSLAKPFPFWRLHLPFHCTWNWFKSLVLPPFTDWYPWSLTDLALCCDY